MQYRQDWPRRHLNKTPKKSRYAIRRLLSRPWFGTPQVAWSKRRGRVLRAIGRIHSAGKAGPFANGSGCVGAHGLVACKGRDGRWRPVDGDAPTHAGPKRTLAERPPTVRHLAKAQLKPFRGHRCLLWTDSGSAEKLRDVAQRTPLDFIGIESIATVEAHCIVQ